MCKAPKAPPPPDPVSEEDFPQPPQFLDEAVVAARRDQIRRAKLAGGHNSTILTGGRGLEDDAETITPTLLGSDGPQTFAPGAIDDDEDLLGGVTPPNNGRPRPSVPPLLPPGLIQLPGGGTIGGGRNGRIGGRPRLSGSRTSGSTTYGVVR